MFLAPPPPPLPWHRLPYPADRRAEDRALVARAAAAAGTGASVRLAGAADGPAIAELEARLFADLRGDDRPGPEYDPGLFVANRLGWILRIVAEDARGIVAYAIVQVRADEIYLYEVGAVGGRGKPGHALFHTLARVAAELGLAALTTTLGRRDRMAGLARGHARLGMRPGSRPGRTLTGQPVPRNWMWLSGQVAELGARRSA